MLCGLLGRKLGHSFSPQIHAHLGEYQYLLFEKEPDALESFLREDNFRGVNVTIPYKKDAAKLCDTLSPVAQRLGAVNTILKEDGKLIGHNTDYFGFTSMVKQSGLDLKSKKILVLGSGGASATVVAVTEDLAGIPVVISRNGENNYQNLQIHSDASVIVNATPVGMYPNNGESPLCLDMFPQLEGVLDLIYNPASTKLLLDAKKRNLIAQNGLWMLVAQAKESAEWFTGSKIPDSFIHEIYNDLRMQMENIVLIGMPGSGKSTIGRILAQQLDRPFFDSDQEIEQEIGKTIPEIFKDQGEQGFRCIESNMLSKLCKKSGCVIATGGGCVTKEENLSNLQQNGKVIWIQRDLTALPTDGRPLSQGTNLQEMYALRQPLYEKVADIQVSNNRPVNDVVYEILQAIRGGV